MKKRLLELIRGYLDARGTLDPSHFFVLIAKLPARRHPRRDRPEAQGPIDRRRKAPSVGRHMSVTGG
jgi:hypothetical protein